VSESPSPPSRQHGAEQKLADYAMIFDMLGLLTGITKEETAINKIMEIFTLLFAPQSLIYISIMEGKTQVIKTHPPSLSLSDDTIKRLQTFPDNAGWTDSKKGFSLTIQHSGQTLGVVAMDEILFVEHKRHYLNLALAMAPVLALVISNVRNFQAKERLIFELQDALAKVKTLSGLLPICANCKKIRDDSGYWNRIEAYIGKHADVQFTHGICPDCAKKLYPELFEEKGAEETVAPE
jgi:hypothetical protein